MSKDTTPNRLALCIMLADGNHMAGVLLERIMHWRQYGNAVIPTANGKWIANDRNWWMQEAQLSADQYDRTMAKLKKGHLIEARQWWWGKRNILHLRPSAKTLYYLAVAKSWQAAHEFLDEGSSIEKISNSAEPASAVLLNSNGFSKSAELSSAPMLNSNNMGNVHAYYVSEEQELTCAPPAAPSCAAFGFTQEKKGYGEEKSSIPASSISAAPPGPKASSIDGLEPPTIKQLVSIWRAVMLKYYGKAVAQNLTCCNPSPSEVGMIAQFLARLKTWIDGELIDWRAYAPHILAFGVSEWSKFKGTDEALSQFPTIEKLCATDAGQAEVLSEWIEAGYPDHDLGEFLEAELAKA